jgi:hypothetical protein
LSNTEIALQVLRQARVGHRRPAGLPMPSGSPSLLLWGAKVVGPETETLCHAYLTASDQIKERRRGRTEVDVLLAWPSLIVSIEVKHRSRNDQPKGRRPFTRYVANAPFQITEAEVAQVGLYQLTRNWSLGTRLAQALRRQFLLINLGPVRIKKDADAFAELLDETPTRRFAFVSWPAL